MRLHVRQHDPQGEVRHEDTERIAMFTPSSPAMHNIATPTLPNKDKMDIRMETIITLAADTHERLVGMYTGIAQIRSDLAAQRADVP